ncbi:resolvase [Enterococcus faecium]|nr:resolvase [Enterococcus faecium]EGP5213298.1 resolvase [Enterococcus faecium]MDN3079580.1 resolvase [Enterococcus faecium]MDQ8230790.1 resolvase [Enterococcus faecium]MDQ8233280.1 resolvase [Enterococcus faecium]MDQ8240639.1 resolvase [Enterococcus faecium]
MDEAMDHPLLDKFIKDLIFQIFSMIDEQEPTESKRHRAQVLIKIAKANVSIKGVLSYTVLIQKIPNHLVYKNNVED